MDGLTIALEVVLPVASAVSSAAFVVWRVARKWEETETRATAAHELGKRNESDIRAMNEEANRQWQQIGYTLGRIEGAMTGEPGQQIPPPLPPRGRLPSRGG